MLSVVEKRIRGGIKQMYCHAIHRYAKSNNKYREKKDMESSYLKYLNANNLY